MNMLDEATKTWFRKKGREGGLNTAKKYTKEERSKQVKDGLKKKQAVDNA